MANLSRPIPESYWVLPGRMLAGEYPGAYEEERTRKRLDALIEAGFDLLIDLTEPREMLPYEAILREQAGFYGAKVDRLPHPIADFGVPTPEKMNTILDAIDDGLRLGRKIYVHCWGGIGRTGTTIGCYLVRQGKTGAEALEQLSAWWRTVPKSRYHPDSPESGEQMKFILDWAVHDRRSSGNA